MQAIDAAGKRGAVMEVGRLFGMGGCSATARPLNLTSACFKWSNQLDWVASSVCSLNEALINLHLMVAKDYLF